MKVAVVSWLFPSLHFPANGIFVKEEIDRLASSVDIRLIAPLHNQYVFGEPSHFTAGAGYPVVRPYTPLFPRWFMQRLSPLCMSMALNRTKGFIRGCDLVHVHNAFSDTVAAVRAYGRDFPLVSTVHGSDVNLFIDRPDVGGMILRALNKTRLVICVSRSLETTLLNHGMTAPTKVIPNGLDTSIFTPSDKRTAAADLGLDPDRPRILYAGNFLPWKGIEHLVRAVPAVLRLRPDCEVVLLGARPDGSDSTRYHELAGSLGVSHAVRVKKWVPASDLPRWINAADAFCLPSLKEGFGIVAAQALACGKPVVATRSGGPEDIVTEGLGMIVPPGDHEALADALAKVLSGEGLSSPDAIAASARERFSYNTVINSILAAYDRIVSSPH